MPPSVRNRRLGMVSPRRGLTKQSRRIPSDGGQGLHAFFNTLAKSGYGQVVGEGGLCYNRPAEERSLLTDEPLAPQCLRPRGVCAP